MTKTVEVFDSIMGSGKTKAIMEWMQANPDNNYLYVSPLLSEVEDRIPNECPSLDFVTPSTEGTHKTKSSHLLELLHQGRNICTTHSMYTQMTEEHAEAVVLSGYTLIIDEEVDFIQRYDRYTVADIISLKAKKFISIDYESGGRVDWLWEDIESNTAYERLKNDCKMGMLYVTKRGLMGEDGDEDFVDDTDEDDEDIGHDKSKKQKSSMLVTHIPPKLVDSCERVIVLTYKYYGSLMERFFSLRGYDHIPFTEVATYKSEQDIIQGIAANINMIQTPSSRKVGSLGMSVMWYRDAKTVDKNRIGKAISSVARSAGAKNGEFIYTMPKDAALGRQGKSPKKPIVIPKYNNEINFLYSGCRATNDYADRHTAIHAYNRFPNIAVSAYLYDYGYPVDVDNFALTEMVQWIWRTQIRDGKPINLAILSPRMRTIFNRWLEGK